jgi:hypothetical protein
VGAAQVVHGEEADPERRGGVGRARQPARALLDAGDGGVAEHARPHQVAHGADGETEGGGRVGVVADGSLHAHQVGPVVQHQRGLELLGVEHAARPGGRVRVREQRLQAGVEELDDGEAERVRDPFADRVLDRLAVGLVPADDGEGAHAAALGALGEVVHHGEVGVEREGERARDVAPGPGVAERERGQDQPAGAAGDLAHEALRQQRVGRERQVRAVLLGGADVQQRVGVRGEERADLGQGRLGGVEPGRRGAAVGQGDAEGVVVRGSVGRQRRPCR